MNRFDIEQLNGTLKGKMRISSSWQLLLMAAGGIAHT